MRRSSLVWTMALLLACLAASARAQTPACDALSVSRQAVAAELLTQLHPYDCCDDTIAACLERKPTCSLAFRLAENICRRVAERQPRRMIIDAVQRRRKSILRGGLEAAIDLTGLSVAGEPTAPITLVEYACPRCPYCARMTLRIHDAVVKGPLEGKVRLYLKTFPLRGHRGAKESGLAFVAAGKLGHFWEFVSYFYERFQLFSVFRQLEWAEAVGMNMYAFQQTMADPATRQLLVDMKKEGIANGVDGTPTLFVNGRRYEAELTPEEVVDVLEEEFDRAKGIRYRD